MQVIKAESVKKERFQIDQSSFFFLQMVVSVWLVTPPEDETAGMAQILTRSKVSGPAVTGFSMFVYTGLKIQPLPENLT